MNIRETLEARGFDRALIDEAISSAEALKAAGYNDDTVEALYESYLGDCTTITGEFTLEKLMMAIDEDQAFAEFWEGTNA